MNRRQTILATLVTALALVAGVPAALGITVPLADLDDDHDDDHDHHDDYGVGPEDLVERYLPRPAGVEREMRFFFGPFTIPPGQDMNRVTLDVPVHDGFITAIAPNLVDVQAGTTPSNQEMHIHHAHWFRVSDDPNDEYYALNLAWIFGTGEERTQGSFNDRSDAVPGGPRYGLYIAGGEPQALIYMLHNKLATVQNVYVTLDVRFTYGTAEEIAAADGCPGLLPDDGEVCRAGEDFHNLRGKLWGTTFDVPRDHEGDGVYTHPVDIPADAPERRDTDDLGRYWVSGWDGTLIATAGHLHPNGMNTVLANLGPEGSGCEADLDGDGLPGVTLLNSRKIEKDPRAWPHSEEYQMAATKFGYRAPIREGDRITQFGVYDNGEYASYEAMSFAGMYIDTAQPPAPRGAEGCTLANTEPVLVDDPTGDATEGILNHEWHAHSHPFCGPAFEVECERPVEDRGEGEFVEAVHIAGFVYAPGDLSLSGPLGAPPKVREGESLTFVNEDTGLLVRHSVTSCAFPCNGPYVANYPQPDGDFDSGKLGNLDYIDGGLTGDDTVPVWETPTDLEVGTYSYYCRIHPWMRGSFEVVPADA